MAKLWDKGYALDKEVEKFTVGEDYTLDQKLVEADVAGSIAHAKMLAKIGVLKGEEFSKLKSELLKILELHNKGKFEITPEDEDIHTAIENHLTSKLGDLGKKIHTARSRNDQVLVDMRLYAKWKMLDIKESLLNLCQTLLDFAEKNKDVPIPGRTHTQLAMPSSLGLWAGAYAESLLDDLEVLKTAYEINDQCPLGSAASYGVPLLIDRQMVADLLGFKKVQKNVLYANNSRGKVESIILGALSQIMVDLSKFANDAILFSIPELDYFDIPDEFCTGSSIMPNKKNPGALELVRAKSNKVLAGYYQVVGIIKDLYSGYNRDFQETKKPVMEGLAVTKASLDICALVVSGLKVNKVKCIRACKPEIFATDKAVELVGEGMPFRDAYKKVAAELDKLEGEDATGNIKGKKHLGATGNLGLAKSVANIKVEKEKVTKEKKSLELMFSKLKKI